MTDTASRHARRRFLKLATAGVAAVPLCGACLARLAYAQERVKEDDELAQQLGYKEDTLQRSIRTNGPTTRKGTSAPIASSIAGSQGRSGALATSSAATWSPPTAGACPGLEKEA